MASFTFLLLPDELTSGPWPCLEHEWQTWTWHLDPGEKRKTLVSSTSFESSSVQKKVIGIYVPEP